MNKEEFNKITVEVLDKLIDDFTEKGMSPQAALAATLSMGLYASKLSERLFGCDELEIEV